MENSPYTDVSLGEFLEIEGIHVIVPGEPPVGPRVVSVCDVSVHGFLFYVEHEFVCRLVHVPRRQEDVIEHHEPVFSHRDVARLELGLLQHETLVRWEI